MSTRQQIIGLLTSTKRSGIEPLIKYLVDEGFFESPASTKFRGCYTGGLADHSLAVYEKLHQLCLVVEPGVARDYGQQPLPVTPDNIIIAALLHDICKIGAYIPTPGVKKPYKGNRQKPKGHALLSIERIKKYIELTELEELMIKYHMGPYGTFEFGSYCSEYPIRGDKSLNPTDRRGKSLANAWYHNPIVKLMYFCDELATLEEKAKED